MDYLNQRAFPIQCRIGKRGTSHVHVYRTLNCYGIGRQYDARRPEVGTAKIQKLCRNDQLVISAINPLAFTMLLNRKRLYAGEGCIAIELVLTDVQTI